LQWIPHEQVISELLRVTCHMTHMVLHMGHIVMNSTSPNFDTVN